MSIAPRVVNNEHLHIAAWCDRCHAVSTFETGYEGRRYGQHGWHEVTDPDDQDLLDHEELYVFYKCTGCNRGAVAEFRTEHRPSGKELFKFLPTSVATQILPDRTPSDVEAEYREAELAASAGAYRAGSAMLRSALEKTLNANGYTTGSLKQKIDNAAGDGVITAARKDRAHQEVRVLGNEVVHDVWRAVDVEEFQLAHQYVHRVIEDFYEHRDEVESVLAAANRSFAAA